MTLMAARIYDISIPLSAGTPVWPTSERFNLKWEKTTEKEGVNESSLCLNTHSGTHIDMPFHFHHGGKRSADISIDRYIGNALVVEYPGNGSIRPDFLKQIEIPSGCQKILFKTQNSFGKIIEQRSFQEDYIALSPEGAEWIVRNNIDLVGIDYLSIASFGEKDDRTHKILLAAEILILEGLDLRKITEGLYRLVALPLHIPEAEAAPARAVLIQGDLC